MDRGRAREKLAVVGDPLMSVPREVVRVKPLDSVEDTEGMEEEDDEEEDEGGGVVVEEAGRVKEDGVEEDEEDEEGVRVSKVEVEVEVGVDEEGS